MTKSEGFRYRPEQSEGMTNYIATKFLLYDIMRKNLCHPVKLPGKESRQLSISNHQSQIKNPQLLN